MGAVSVGSLGIDCLKNVERMRSKSRNLHGGISGKMKEDLARAMDTINTIIFKAEASGDSAKLKMDNRCSLNKLKSCVWRMSSVREK